MTARARCTSPTPGRTASEKFAPDGTYLGQWGYVSARSGFAAPNTGDGQFTSPYGIAYDRVHDQVWVADTDNNRVQVFNSAGAWIAKFGGLTAGSGAGQFSRPVGMAADTAGNVYVADAGNDRIQRRDGSTGAWTTVDTHGATLNSPRAVAADGDAVYVAAGNRVLRLTATGTTAVTAPGAGFENPGGLWVAGPYLYVSDTGNNRVVRQDRRTGTWVSFGDEGNGPGSFLGPLGLTTNSQGDVLFVADQLNNRIERFGPPAPRSSGSVTAVTVTPTAAAPTPAFRLRAKVLSKNRRAGTVRLAVRCTLRCQVTVSGRLRIPGRRGSQPLRVLRISGQPGVNRKLTLKLSASARKRLHRSRPGSRRASMKLSVLATNAAGNQARRTLTVRL